MLVLPVKNAAVVQAMHGLSGQYPQYEQAVSRSFLVPKASSWSRSVVPVYKVVISQLGRRGFADAYD